MRVIAVNTESAIEAWGGGHDSFSSTWEDFDWWMNSVVTFGQIKTDTGYIYPYSHKVYESLVRHGIQFEILEWEGDDDEGL